MTAIDEEAVALEQASQDAAGAGEVAAGDFRELSDEALRLELDKFEGPFEMLLYLIRAQEIDVFDIPILKVTEQYLHFLELMREENLDVAGDFIVMAATLIQIKSRMILPIEIEEEEEEIEEEDPRLELVEKLLEYRRFRDLSAALGRLEEARAGCYARFVQPKYEHSDDEEDYLEVSLFDLTKSLRAVLRFLCEEPVHRIGAEAVSVDEKITLIEQLLIEHDSLAWSDLTREGRSRIELVCCLLAILELCRMGRVRAHQHGPFGEIRIFARTPGEETAADVVAT